MPIRFSIVGVAARAPRIDFFREHGGVGDAAGEALAGENGQLGFREIEPAAVFGRVVPLESFDDPPGLRRASAGSNAL